MAKMKGHKRGCHCVGCDASTRARGRKALKAHKKRKRR